MDTLRQRYYELHDIANNILIEVNLQTSWTDLLLDLNRWTIFLEDDQGNQYEPKKIIERNLPISFAENNYTEPVSNIVMIHPFNTHQKQIYIYFPRNDHYGQSIIHKKVNYLKIIFLQEKSGYARAEGIWIFNW